MFWRDFPTKTAAMKAMRDLLNSRPFKTPFESSLLSDLIAERHYFCSVRKLRPLRFRKLPGYGAYNLEGEFREVGWHAVSWTKCLMAPLTPWERIVRAMRDRTEPVKAEYKRCNPLCETCGLTASKEVHHSQPTFRVICEMVHERVTDADVDDALQHWNWFAQKNFALPDDHAITTVFEQIHARAKLQALCRDCHNRTKKKTPVR
jgi:5-methylcytosine-specific restriction endonuclease McrA